MGVVQKADGLAVLAGSRARVGWKGGEGEGGAGAASLAYTVAAERQKRHMRAGCSTWAYHLCRLWL